MIYWGGGYSILSTRISHFLIFEKCCGSSLGVTLTYALEFLFLFLIFGLLPFIWRMQLTA